MHYKNGREVRVADAVIGRDANGAIVSGTVSRTIEGADACNVYVAAGMDPAAAPTERVCTASELWHAEDAMKKRAGKK
jgi:hypothetical protein